MSPHVPNSPLSFPTSAGKSGNLPSSVQSIHLLTRKEVLHWNPIILFTSFNAGSKWIYGWLYDGKDLLDFHLDFGNLVEALLSGLRVSSTCLPLRVKCRHLRKKSSGSRLPTLPSESAIYPLPVHPLDKFLSIYVFQFLCLYK